jgi:hypothetical protein
MLKKQASPVRTDAFERFWAIYPKKRSRAAAEKAWRKLAPSPELIQRILDAVAAHRTDPDWLKNGGEFIPYPASWLNGRRWEDVPMVALPSIGKRTRSLAAATRDFIGDSSHDSND